jgi:hypothetical protein
LGIIDFSLFLLIWEDKIFHSHTNNMTVVYPQNMINRNGWATATEIEAAANLFAIWFKYKYLATSLHIVL